MYPIPGWGNGVSGGKGLTCWLHVNMVALLSSEYFGTIDPGIMISIIFPFSYFYLLPSLYMFCL